MMSLVGFLFGMSLWRASGIQTRVTETESPSPRLGNSAPLSEDGFLSVVALKSDEDMKAYIHRLLSSEARFVADKGKLNGFVGFYSGTSAHLGHKGSHKCVDGENPSEELCLQTAQKLIPEGQVQGRVGLQSGEYPAVPPGCSVQSGGDWAAHYNKKVDALNNGAYSPVCFDNHPERRLDDLKAELRRMRWVADGLGRTAELSADGFQKVIKLACTGNTRAFLRRVLESEHAKVADDASFDRVVRYEAADSNFDELKAQLLSSSWVVPLEHWQGLSGSTAPLTEDGYSMVAKLKSDAEMAMFVRRVVASEARTIVDEAAFSGVVPFYSGTTSVQTLDGLKSEIRHGSSWVGLDIGRTAPLSEEGYQQVAARRSNVQMKEFARRMLATSGSTIDPGSLNGLVPYHSGKVMAQSFEKLQQDLAPFTAL